MIRKARKGDIESIHQLDRESVEYHKRFDKDFFEMSAHWWKIKKVSQLKAMKNNSELILVAELDRRVVGYIWGYIDTQLKNRIGKIQELIVTSEYRGKGIGTSLIKKMLEYFKKRKCIIADIEVYVDNLPTIKAYEHAGFRKREYKMRLLLDKKKKFRPFSG